MSKAMEMVRGILYPTDTEVYPTRDQWLLARRRGIGGSDAPILLGQDTTRGAADLWLEKVDGKSDSESTERMKWGIRQEPGIRAGYAEDSGRQVIAPESPFTIIRRRADPWLTYSPDGTQYSPDFEGPGVLQIKNVGGDQRWKWQEGPPEKYVVQLQHEMMVGGNGWGTLVALFGGNECAWWDLEANATFWDAMYAVEKDFWQHVEDQKCPPVDTHLRTALQTLKHLYPESDRATISLDGDRWTEMLEELQGYESQIKLLTEEANELKAEFQSAMQKAEAAILSDGRQVTWKSQSRKEYTVAAASFRVFRYPKAKG
jgi:predicted phage-related endonuclease